MAEANLRDASVAADYDLIYADWDGWVDRVEQLMAGHLPVLPRAALLDATCGSGMACQAASRLGFTVTGVDTSPAMVELARRRLTGVDLQVADVRSLSSVFGPRFDAVISIGNALPALDPGALPVALQQMRAVCHEGGTLMVAIRDFSERIKSGVWRDDPVARVTARFVYDRPGAVVYVLEIQDADGFRSHEMTLHPISPFELAAAVEAAGFRVARQAKTAGRAVVSAVAA